MQTDRRNWLRQIGLATAGLGLVQFKSIASASANLLNFNISDNNQIRLNTNENPYGPSPLARTAMADSINNSNRYNWNVISDLISAIAGKNNVASENILVGAGSTEILDVIIQTFACQKGNFIVADPTFSNWSKKAEKSGLKKIAVPLTSEKKHDLTSMSAAIDDDTKLLYICNPNNPTGTICENSELVSFIKEATKKVTVMVDEAYIEFTDQKSLSNLVAENKNLIVVKTFSKIYGLAGARIGYAIAHPDTITKISELQSWANGGISLVSRKAAIASLQDHDFIKQCYSRNESARKHTMEQLTKLNMICIPSSTNFIYFSLTNYKKDYFELLKSNNILGTGIYEENGKWTRITVGTMEEMQKFIHAIS